MIETRRKTKQQYVENELTNRRRLHDIEVMERLKMKIQIKGRTS